ncbi:MAG: RidA family protein [Clostridiales bacterium]|nr:RidA family protein [Clostridiales bacterium]
MARVIATEKAPAAVGAYSQAIATGKLVFTSGQLGLDPATGELREGVEAQARQAMDNLGAVLAEAGAGYETVVKTVIYLADIADFAAVNEIYAGYFEQDPPARSCFQVAALPKGGLLEIECVAEIK